MTAQCLFVLAPFDLRWSEHWRLAPFRVPGRAQVLQINPTAAVGTAGALVPSNVSGAESYFPLTRVRPFSSIMECSNALIVGSTRGWHVHCPQAKGAMAILPGSPHGGSTICQ